MPLAHDLMSYLLDRSLKSSKLMDGFILKLIILILIEIIWLSPLGSYTSVISYNPLILYSIAYPLVIVELILISKFFINSLYYIFADYVRIHQILVFGLIIIQLFTKIFLLIQILSGDYSIYNISGVLLKLMLLEIFTYSSILILLAGDKNPNLFYLPSFFYQIINALISFSWIIDTLTKTINTHIASLYILFYYISSLYILKNWNIRTEEMPVKFSKNSRIEILANKVWNNLIHVALDDGIITIDERKLLGQIMYNLNQYGELLEEAWEDGIITQNEKDSLYQARQKLFVETRDVADSNAVVTQDEQAILSWLITINRELEELEI